MDNIKNEISKNLLFYRKKARLTQKQLAEKLGVKNSAVSNWENNLNSINIETLLKVCEIFGISINDICNKKSNDLDNRENNTIGKKIKELRLEKNVSQEELAKIINTTKQNIYKYENGIINNIPIKNLELIANYFDISPNYLAGWNNEYIETGKRIKELRENKGISQEELAKLAGYTSRSSINKIELGKTNLSQSRIVKIANALGVTPAYIIGWSEENEKPLEFTNHEKNVIKAYRAKPEMQPAVDKLLGVENADALLEDMKNTAKGVNFPTKQK